MRALVAAALAVMLTAGSPPSAKDGERSWRSPVPIDKVQQMVRDLESDPLGKNADALRAYLVKYFDNMRPEFVVCLAQFQPLMQAEKEAHKNLWLQVPISSGSFLLDHPEAIEDTAAYQLAGLEGMLRVYTKMLASDPSLRHDFLDQLVRLQHDGKLGEHVRTHPCPGD
jgi:hypothetical protein